jgi:hypothetical protein
MHYIYLVPKEVIEGDTIRKEMEALRREKQLLLGKGLRRLLTECSR